MAKKNPIQILIVTHSTVKVSKRITKFISVFKEVSEANNIVFDIFYVDEYFRIDPNDIKTKPFKVDVTIDDKVVSKSFGPTNRVVALIDDDVMRFAEGQVFVRILKMKGITLINDFETSILCNNRYMMYMMLKRYGINTLTSEYVTQFNQRYSIGTLMDKVTYPSVISSNNGSGAVNIRVTSYLDAIRAIKNNITMLSPIIIQPVIDATHCVRVITLDGNVMASIKTTKIVDNVPDFSTYVEYTPNDDEIQFVRSVTRAIDVDMGCVDFVTIDDVKTVISIEASFTKYGTNDVFVKSVIDKVINNIINVIDHDSTDHDIGDENDEVV